MDLFKNGLQTSFTMFKFNSHNSLHYLEELNRCKNTR